MTVLDWPNIRRMSRHPIELWLAFATFSSTVVQFFTAPNGTLSGDFTLWVLVLWGGMSVFGSITVIIGIALRNDYLGLRMESVGCLSVGISNSLYGISSFLYVGMPSIYVDILSISYGMAFLFRRRQLEHLLREIRHRVQELSDAQESTSAAQPQPPQGDQA